MLVRSARVGLALVLATTLGLHWMLLQTVAWTTMLADNLQSSSFSDAVVKTFDGKHPCPLCKAIAAGKKSEGKNEFTVQLNKLEFPPAAENARLLAPSRFQVLPRASNASAKSLAKKPPTPPPRSRFV